MNQTTEKNKVGNFQKFSMPDKLGSIPESMMKPPLFSVTGTMLKNKPQKPFSHGKIVK